MRLTRHVHTKIAELRCLIRPNRGFPPALERMAHRNSAIIHSAGLIGNIRNQDSATAHRHLTKTACTRSSSASHNVKRAPSAAKLPITSS